MGGHALTFSCYMLFHSIDSFHQDPINTCVTVGVSTWQVIFPGNASKIAPLLTFSSHFWGQWPLIKVSWTLSSKCPGCFVKKWLYLSSVWLTHKHTLATSILWMVCVCGCVHTDSAGWKIILSSGGLHKSLEIWFISNQPFFAKRSGFSLLQLVSVLSASVMRDMLSPPSISFIRSLLFFMTPLLLHLQLLFRSHSQNWVHFLWALEYYRSVGCLDEPSPYSFCTVRIPMFGVKAWGLKNMIHYMVKAWNREESRTHILKQKGRLRSPHRFILDKSIQMCQMAR